MERKKSILIILGLVLVLIVGVLLTRAVTAPTPEIELIPEETEIEEEVSETDTSSEETSSVELETIVTQVSETLTVGPQAPGSVVNIDSVEISTDRWLVVHDNLDGQPGNILGARIFSSDQASGHINLLRATESGQSYLVLIYAVAERDEDQSRRFDSSRDLPLIDNSGALQAVEFQVLGEEDDEETTEDSENE